MVRRRTDCKLAKDIKETCTHSYKVESDQRSRTGTCRRRPDDDGTHPNRDTAVHQDISPVTGVLVGKVAEEPKSDTGRKARRDHECDGGETAESPRLDDSGSKCGDRCVAKLSISIIPVVSYARLT